MRIRNTSFLKKALADDEVVRVEAPLHWVNYVKSCFTSVVMLLLVGGLSFFAVGVAVLLPFVLCWFLYGWLQVSCTQLVITNRRVIQKFGILSISTEELKNAKIESVEIKQSVAGRILGYASIYFSGTGTSDVVFETIADPWEVKKLADVIISEAQ